MNPISKTLNLEVNM